jgi:hypothetical protein
MTSKADVRRRLRGDTDMSFSTDIGLSTTAVAMALTVK